MFNQSSIIVAKLQPVTKILFGTAVAGTFVLTVWKYMRRNQVVSDIQKSVIVITGCDTGLGYNLALHCAAKGFHVFAGVLNLNSVGAESLKANQSELGSLTVVKLDVTGPNDINDFVKVVSQHLDKHPDYYLHSIINNAGVMVFGEFEWLTENIIFQQLNVNLLGAMRFTKAFLPLLRKYKGRIINVSSHCANAALPGLSVYAASKSGLQAWNDAIRVEYSKYGIKVISVMPGSFIRQSNILAKQLLHAEEMENAMAEETRIFYGDYYHQYQQYVGAISCDNSLYRVEDKKFYDMFNHALISKNPNSKYVNSPLRYKIYYFLFQITPIQIRDRLVEYFVSMPIYKK